MHVVVGVALHGGQGGGDELLGLLVLEPHHRVDGLAPWRAAACRCATGTALSDCGVHRMDDSWQLDAGYQIPSVLTT